MLEMLLRGKKRAGLFEALAAVRAESRIKAARPRRALAAGLAAAGLAVLVLGCGALWLGLGSRGPVLGAAPSRQEQPARTAPALQEQTPTGLSAEGVTLQPAAGSGLRAAEKVEADADDQRAAPVSRLTLLPPRDRGPVLRERVGEGLGEGRPPLLNVARPGAGMVAAHLARQAVYEPEGR